MSAKCFSVRRKVCAAKASTTSVTAAETPSAGHSNYSPSSAERNPEMTPTSGFREYQPRHASGTSLTG